MPKPLFETEVSLETILVPLLAIFWMLLIAGAIYGRPTFPKDGDKDTKKDK
jgi:hypothetical protein